MAAGEDKLYLCCGGRVRERRPQARVEVAEGVGESKKVTKELTSCRIVIYPLSAAAQAELAKLF
jgi:hypothetical protein